MKSSMEILSFRQMMQSEIFAPSDVDDSSYHCWIDLANHTIGTQIRDFPVAAEAIISNTVDPELGFSSLLDTREEGAGS